MTNRQTPQLSFVGGDIKLQLWCGVVCPVLMSFHLDRCRSLWNANRAKKQVQQNKNTIPLSFVFGFLGLWEYFVYWGFGCSHFVIVILSQDRFFSINSTYL